MYSGIVAHLHGQLEREVRALEGDHRVMDVPGPLEHVGNRDVGVLVGLAGCFGQSRHS